MSKPPKEGGNINSWNHQLSERGDLKWPLCNQIPGPSGFCRLDIALQAGTQDWALVCFVSRASSSVLECRVEKSWYYERQIPREGKRGRSLRSESEISFDFFLLQLGQPGLKNFDFDDFLLVYGWIFFV